MTKEECAFFVLWSLLWILFYVKETAKTKKISVGVMSKCYSKFLYSIKMIYIVFIIFSLNEYLNQLGKRLSPIIPKKCAPHWKLYNVHVDCQKHGKSHFLLKKKKRFWFLFHHYIHKQDLLKKKKKKKKIISQFLISLTHLV